MARLVTIAVLVMLAGPFCPLNAQKPTSRPAVSRPPAGFSKVDHDIRIGVLPGRLRYDKESFTVEPGSKVKLTLINVDSMQHNLLICVPGKSTLAKVAMAAAALGAKASDVHFVPKMPEVLFATRAIFPGKADVIWFRAPEKPGQYPYVCTLPGHVFTMRGVMHVGRIASQPRLQDLTYQLFKGKWKKLPPFDELSPEREGSLVDGLIDLDALKEGSQFGALFRGMLPIQKAGKYTFFLASDDGSRMHVDGKKILEHDGVHGAGKEHKAELVLGLGHHDVRVEYFQGGGGKALRIAFEGPGQPRRSLTKGKKRRPPKGIPIAVIDRPVVMRVHVEQAAARSIAVGLRGGMNYCFDAEACRVQFGWAGAYLDVGPDRLGRGGRPCKVLGRRFGVGDLGFPLRGPDGARRPVQFRGYRTGKSPEFLLDWGGREVRWTVEAAPRGVGLRYTFEIAGAAELVRFVIDPKDLRLAASAGRWRSGTLHVPKDSASKFHVTLTRVPEVGK